jgi:hypothetical protein
VDPTQSLPALPSGNPFINVQSGDYWSATTSGFSASQAWYVGFDYGYVNYAGEGSHRYAWCVRSGKGVDVQ